MEKPLCPDLTVPEGLRVIETLRNVPGEGLIRGELHLARLRATCARLGITCRDEDIRAALSDIPQDAPRRVRLTIGAGGDVQVETAPLGPAAKHWQVALARPALVRDDPWLALKTTRRALYDRTRHNLPDGVDEAVFLNENDELCEGTITNLFLGPGIGMLTPAAGCGLLPGILRATLLADGSAREAVLTLHDLVSAPRFWMGNSLRGLIPASLATRADGTPLWLA